MSTESAISPVRCPDPACHWAVHGIPNKHTTTRARHLAEHQATEHGLVQPECLFCQPDTAQNVLIAEAGSAYVRLDNFPSAAGHMEVVPRRHVVSFFDLTPAEVQDIHTLACEARAYVPAAGGWTIGVNEGRAAGRTVDHLHLHLIPRQHGDVVDPRGGIRWVLPDTAPLPGDRPELVQARATTSENTGTYSDLAFSAFTEKGTGGRALPGDRPEPDETDEQRADRLETESEHAAGEHEHCGVTCEAKFPSDMLRNGILWRAIPGSAVMLDELLRRTAAVATTVEKDTAATPAPITEAYPGELFMFRGLVGVLRVVAQHGDMAEVQRLLTEHAADEQDAYTEATTTEETTR